MGCSKCEQNNMPKPIAGSCEIGNQVLEIFNAAEVVDFHTVVIPAQMGDDTVVKPENNSYRNSIVRYEANDHIYIYGSDGIPVPVKTNAGEFNEISGRPKYAGDLMTSDTDIPSVDAAKQEALDAVGVEREDRIASENELSERIDSSVDDLDQNIADLSAGLADEISTRENAVQSLSDRIDERIAAHDADIQAINNTLDKDVIYDLEYESNTSTVNVIEDSVNILTGETDHIVHSFPVATASQSGIISPTTYQSIQTMADKVNVIESGTVAIMNIPSDPDQSALTDAWKQATGIDELINGARIKDVDNGLLWTYYTNTGLWYPAEDVSSVEVNQATNISLGIVKGSTTNGQVAVESDGSLSLNGYDALVTSTTSNSTNIANLQSNKADKTTVPTITVTSTDPGEGSTLAANSFVFVY